MRQTIAVFTEHPPPGIKARLRYVLDWLQHHPLAPEGGIAFQLDEAHNADYTLRYGHAEHCHIPADTAVLAADGPASASFRMNAYAFGAESLYSVESRENASDGNFYQNGKFGFDLFAALFFQLSRIEEYHPEAGRQSVHGDFKEEASLLIRSGRHHIPVADRLALAFYRALGFEVPDRPSTLLLSHDIDALKLWRTPLSTLRYLLWITRRQRSLRGWPRLLSDALKVFAGRQPDPADCFDWLLATRADIDKFIFFPTGGNTPFDGFYPLAQAEPAKLKARSAGYSLGLHPSYATYTDAAQMALEQKTFEAFTGEKLRFTRQHFLHFAFPQTADLLESTGGALTDFTLGYRNHIGFRCGTGFPYRLYNFNTEKPYSWTEQPLVLMDVALLRELEMQRDRLEPFWRQFFEENRSNTRISLNFHNTFFYEFECYGWGLGRLYEEMKNEK